MLLVHDGVPDWWALVLLEAGVETGGVDVLVDAAPVVAVELDEMDEVLVPSDVLCEPEPDVELVHPTSTALAAHNNVVNCP